MLRTPRLLVVSTFAMSVALSTFAVAQAGTFHARPLITQRVDDSQRMVARGNTRPEARPENDMGLVRDDMQLHGLQLVLKRAPEQQSAFEALIADQHDPKSASFHKWLTNAEVKEQFSPAAADVEKVTDWLRAEGFRVDSASGMVIEFSGTAGQVRTAFHAPIHSLLVNGKAHFANFNDPEFPAAFAPVLHGTASLHNFMPKPQHTPALKAQGDGYAGNGYNDVTAGDVAKIYNFNPLFAQGISGRGQTIVVVEDTDLYSAGDWNVFRKVLGLSRAFPYGKLVQANPTGTSTCTDPGVNSDDVEAILDVEYSSAAAPNATIVNAACDDTEQFGGFLALENLLEGPTPPTVVSISYGEAEADLGSVENAYIYNLYMTAAAEGTSVFVSSGDEGAASADANRTRATHGIQVSGFTSTPYNISVGGTDFGYIPLHLANTYFSTTNSPFYVTAQSNIPEIPWNDSCASPLIATYVGRPNTGPTSYCNVSANLRTTASGSGGPSGCAYGDATLGDNIGEIISGNCAPYAKPAFQNLTGVPSDGVRDIPDVSLFAANGVWGNYYAFCYTDQTLDSGVSRGGTPCLGDPATWNGAGGTSISSPIWAGIQALVNQKTGESWGNSNTVLYALARAEYGTTGTGTAACNSSLGAGVGSNCVFYDVTQGDIVVDCTGTLNCYRGSGGTYGALSLSSTVYQPAYLAHPGWDFATGIGTANATNLVNAWASYAGGGGGTQ